VAQVQNWKNAKSKGSTKKVSGLEHSLDSIGKARVSNKDQREHNLREFWSHDVDTKKDQQKEVLDFIFGTGENPLQSITDEFNKRDKEIDGSFAKLLKKQLKDKDKETQEE
jgi:uncharacterized protein YaaN involved in tellurite resistance